MLPTHRVGMVLAVSLLLLYPVAFGCINGEPAHPSDPCTKCWYGFYGVRCDKACTCRSGQCDSTPSESGGTCLSCYGNYAGVNCDDCKTGFGGRFCTACVCVNGICDEGRNGTGFCRDGSCTGGYKGKSCDRLELTSTVTLTIPRIPQPPSTDAPVEEPQRTLTETLPGIIATAVPTRPTVYSSVMTFSQSPNLQLIRSELAPVLQVDPTNLVLIRDTTDERKVTVVVSADDAQRVFAALITLVNGGSPLLANLGLVGYKEITTMTPEPTAAPPPPTVAPPFVAEAPDDSDETIPSYAIVLIAIGVIILFVLSIYGLYKVYERSERKEEEAWKADQRAAREKEAAGSRKLYMGRSDEEGHEGGEGGEEGETGDGAAAEDWNNLPGSRATPNRLRSNRPASIDVPTSTRAAQRPSAVKFEDEVSRTKQRLGTLDAQPQPAPQPVEPSEALRASLASPGIEALAQTRSHHKNPPVPVPVPPPAIPVPKGKEVDDGLYSPHESDSGDELQGVRLALTQKPSQPYMGAMPANTHSAMGGTALRIGQVQPRRSANEEDAVPGQMYGEMAERLSSSGSESDY